MSTYTVPRSASTGVYPNFPSPSPVAAEDEPDEEWKEKKRNEIENGFKDMIQEAKARLEQKMQMVTAKKESREYEEQRAFYFQEYQQEQANLRSLAKEEFTHALGLERVTRRLTRGGQINGTVKVSVVEEQEAILAQIQRDNTRRRDSTIGPSPPPNISAGPSSERPAPTSQEFSQRQPEPLRVPRREATQPAPGPTSPPPSSDVPSSPQPPSPETSKPPPRPYHPGPPPPETRASAPQPPTSAPDPRLSSHGRTATAPAQERPAPTTGAPFPPPTALPSPEQHFPANASSSSHRAQTSPASAGGPRGGGPLRQTTGPRNPPPDRTSPGIGPHGRTNFDSYSATTAPLRPKMSQTWNAATSPPIPIPIVAENHSRVAPLIPKRSQSSMHSTWNDATPPSSFPTQGAENHRISPLTAKRSQSNFHSSTGRRAESVWMGSGSEMTAEPEEEEEEPAYASEPAVPARPRDEGVEKETPLAGSPPAARPPPQVWKPSMTEAEFIALERSGSSLRAASSGGRKPIPSMVDPPPPGPSPVDVEKNIEREEAQRQENERSWESMSKSREKGKERAGGTGQSTASEQQFSRRDEPVSGGRTSHVEGSSTSARPPDDAPPTFPTSAHSTLQRNAGPPESIPNPSSRASPAPPHFVPGGISATQPSPHVLPPFSSSYSSSAEEDEEEDEYEDDYLYLSPEPVATALPPAAPSSSNQFGTPMTDEYRYSSHPNAVPIPVSKRSPAPDGASAAFSAGEYSRWGIPPPKARSEHSYNEHSGPSWASGASYGSYSSRGEDAAAAERVLEAERAAKKLEEEAQRKVEEARRKEEAAQQKEAAAQQKEADLRLRQAETERKLKEITEREANLRRREEDVRRREEETRQKEAARQRDEAEKQRKEKERQRAEAEKQSEKFREFQHNQIREAEARRRAEERKRQGSVDQESSWAGAAPSSWNTSSRPTPGSPSPSNATSSSARSSSTTGSSTTGPTWSSTSKGSSASGASQTSGSTTGSNTTGPTWSKASSASGASQTSSNARPSSTATPNGKPTWTSTSSTSTPPTAPPYSSSAGSQAGARPSPSSSSKSTPRTNTSSQSNPPPTNPEDWARRQREQAEEQFRKMQEQLERERQAKEQKAGRMLSKEDVVRIYQTHEQQWSKMSAHSEVTWDMLPWPMYKKPNSAEEITSGAVDAYIMSPHYPDQDKSTKDRVRQQLRRWHEDHFNQKVLSKVSERDKERVKAAAGTVTRNLNNLLERTNESKKSASSIFA